jgi:hypothetical protein
VCSSDLRGWLHRAWTRSDTDWRLGARHRSGRQPFEYRKVAAPLGCQTLVALKSRQAAPGVLWRPRASEWVFILAPTPHQA